MIAIIKRKKIASDGKPAENRELLHTVSGDVNWNSYCRNQYGASSKS